MKACVLTIGDEILIGQITDTNSGWIAQRLNEIGVNVVKMLSVGDGEEDIIRGFDMAFKVADVTLVTGGLGPTKDDITKGVIAKYFNDSLEFHQPSYDRIVRIFETRNIPVRESHKAQCFLPSKAQLLKNGMGTAPGIWMREEGKVLLSMPGIPYEMKAIMLDGGGLDKIAGSFPSKAIAHRTILTAGQGETTIANRIEVIEDNLPAHVKLAFLPSLNRVRLRLSGLAENQSKLEAELDKEVEKIKSLIPDLIFGYGDDNLEAAVGRQLLDKKLTLGICESCTGGYLSHLITSVSGSSGYFKGSIISYSNSIKTKVLGVSKETLNSDGAVSEATVRQMVLGGLSSLETDICIATSGIAGPDGGSTEKPIGTIWIAIGNDNIQDAVKIHIGKSRIQNIEYASYYALNMLRQFIIQHY